MGEKGKKAASKEQKTFYNSLAGQGKVGKRNDNFLNNPFKQQFLQNICPCTTANSLMTFYEKQNW